MVFLVIYILYIFCWVGGGSTIPIVAHPSPQKACSYNVQYPSFFLYCPHLEGTIRNSKKSVNQNTVINTFITENRLQVCYILSFLFVEQHNKKIVVTYFSMFLEFGDVLFDYAIINSSHETLTCDDNDQHITFCHNSPDLTVSPDLSLHSASLGWL